ncbi:MAG: SAM-dependent methyltransferase [Deltaproteobacteria bacterium]|nr:MAG: SAM-dependent methyltransferase [Deltaproteobacteria bacterium]
MEKLSADPLLFSREINISQPEKGYRFSMDPFILAAHIQPKGFQKIIDIGCGCGIITLILAARHPGIKIKGVEIQNELARFARENVMNNGLKNAIHIMHENIKNIDVSDINGKADIIVSNPPYKKKDTGRLNPNSQKAIARHEIFLDIDLLFLCSKKLLNSKGRLYIIFPAQRLSDLVLTMERYKFIPDFIRFVHIKKNTAARRVILCATKNHGKPCTIDPPFYVYGSDNKFTDEYTSLFKP